MAKKEQKIVAGLDIGTTKICVVMGSQSEEGKIFVHGYGVAPSQGLKNGMVVDIPQTVASIRQALRAAEDTSGFKIDQVVVGITGAHIETRNVRSVVGVRDPKGGITSYDIQKAVDDAKASIPFDRMIINCIPQDFMCDDQNGIKSPLGMKCRRLEVTLHLVTAAVCSAQNIIQCVNQAGVKVREILLESLASSMAVLHEQEKDLGVLVLDIGGGTCDLAFFDNHIIEFSSNLLFGGDTITRDIYKILHISPEVAERLKKEQGGALASQVNDQERIHIPLAINQRQLPILRRQLCEIIQARLTEILNWAKFSTSQNPIAHSLFGGVVLTGGTSLLRDVELLTESIFELPARVGYPSSLEGEYASQLCNPMYATALGLVIYGLCSDGKQPHNGFFGKIADFFRRLIDPDAH